MISVHTACNFEEDDSENDLDNSNCCADDHDFVVINMEHFQQIPFVSKLAWFHTFFLVILVISVSRVTINIMIFKASVKDAQGMTFLIYESYAILTELASCLLLFIYYKTITRKSQKSSANQSP